MIRRSFKALVVVGLVGVLASLTAYRLSVWGDPVALWTSAMEDSPESPRVLNNLGIALVREGRDEEALQVFEQAVALARDTPHMTAWSGDTAKLNLAILLAHRQQYAEALALLAQIRSRPDYRSLVTHLERQWQAEWLTGQSFTAQVF